MTESEVIEAAREAGFCPARDEWLFREMIIRFAAIIAAKQREKDARICDDRVMGDHNREDAEAKRCANAIRGQE